MRAGLIVGTAALICLLALPASGAAATWTFGYTGGMQTWVVPAGVTAAYFDVSGAGGGEPNNQYGPFGGKGGRAQVELPLTPGSTVHIVVGGKGGYPGAGYNGGGDGRTFGGGGATDIRIGGTGLNDRVLVAGGGGGSAISGSGRAGDGGGLTGGGAGGTQTAGGSGIYPMWSGWFGHGGPGANAGPNVTGGGGGGWYGGAGGPGGGGGGSGHGPDGTKFATGVSSGDGSVTITVGPPAGAYHGSNGRGQAIAFHLSHDYAEVTNFTLGTRVLLRAAPFHLRDGNPGSFSGREGTCTVSGHWSGDHRGDVSGSYICYPMGHRMSGNWTAAGPKP